MAADSRAKGIVAGTMAVREMREADIRAAFVYFDGTKAQVIAPGADFKLTAMLLYQAADAVAEMAMLERKAGR
ncbi:peptide synthetase [Mizugakiibacter sediminis]|uniref:Peptide synthetase n=1 Tax=Mizugakiibacter sediminis TaxID=1475481 RepID=A0A0K8QPJ3_9GAMM|nr:hypothetical protein [Mizugakiibacter sediminis]GAP66810.1 peptide synthetase [Mizugakiibacter sediminis]